MSSQPERLHLHSQSSTESSVKPARTRSTREHSPHEQHTTTGWESVVDLLASRELSIMFRYPIFVPSNILPRLLVYGATRPQRMRTVQICVAGVVNSFISKLTCTCMCAETNDCALRTTAHSEGTTPQYRAAALWIDALDAGHLSTQPQTREYAGHLDCKPPRLECIWHVSSASRLRHGSTGEYLAVHSACHAGHNL